MCPSKTLEGFPCYEYILLYVDDALLVGLNAEKLLRDEVGKFFKLKKPSIGAPKIYILEQVLGRLNLRMVSMPRLWVLHNMSKLL